MAYGATEPYMAGQVVVLAAGEHKTGLTFRLPQLGVLTGTVVDVDGEPAQRVGLQAQRRQFQRGKAVWMQAGWANTDSNGHYRIFHVMPGKYLLSARKYDQPPPAPTAPGQEPDTNRLVYGNTYFPGTLERQQARVVAVGPGQTVDNLDIPLLQSRPITLEVQSDSPAPASEAPTEADLANGGGGGGAPTPFVQLSLVEQNSDMPGGGQFGGGFPLGSRSVFNDLEPGRYVLGAEVTMDGRLYAAREELDLSGGSASVTLHFAPAVDLPGHVRLEGARESASGGSCVSRGGRLQQPARRRGPRAAGWFVRPEECPARDLGYWLRSDSEGRICEVDDARRRGRTARRHERNGGDEGAAGHRGERGGCAGERGRWRAAWRGPCWPRRRARWRAC